MSSSLQIIKADRISRKIATCMQDLKEYEKKQWKKYLDINDLECSEDYFLFDDNDDEYYEGANEEIYVDKWKITLNNCQIFYMTDIYAWPGDNQSGGLFIEKSDVMIMSNSDTSLEKIKLSQDYVHYNFAKLLQSYPNGFESIRGDWSIDCKMSNNIVNDTY